MSNLTNDYELLDSGDGRKLERFGDVVLARPCAQAVWRPSLDTAAWQRAAASFDREEGNRWHGRDNLPASWVITIEGIRMKLAATDFGHLGVFPETRALWTWITDTLRERRGSAQPAPELLNLFAYSGGATLAAVRGGWRACHLDASKGMVEWARENAALNGLGEAPIRWIVEDVHKFLAREIRRGRRYDAIILDPPSFGRGKRGELYQIEKDVIETLGNCAQLLAERAVFLLLTSHTPGFTPHVLENLLRQILPAGELASGEMLLTGAPSTLPVPSGTWARWMGKG